MSLEEQKQIEQEEEIIVEEEEELEGEKEEEEFNDTKFIYTEHKDAIFTIDVNERAPFLKEQNEKFKKEVEEGKKENEKIEGDYVKVNIVKHYVQVVTGSQDDTARLWTVNVGDDYQIVDSKEILKAEDSIINVKFNYDGTLVAVATMEGLVYIFDSEKGKQLKVLEGCGAEIESMEWHPKGNVLLVTSADTTAWLWQAKKAKCIHVFTGHMAAVTCGCFTSDGKLVITGSEDHSVRVWSPVQGNCITVYNDERFAQSPITALASRPNHPNQFLCGTAAGDVFVCQTNKFNILHHLQDIHQGSVEALGVSSLTNNNQNNLIISCAMDGTIVVYDELVKRIRNKFKHKDGVIRMVIDNDAKTPVLYSASVDSTIGVWDIRHGEQMDSLMGHEASVLDIVKLGNHIYSASDDQSARIFKVSF